MGCRPSKHATSKIRDSHSRHSQCTCVYSPRKYTKKHKCNSTGNISRMTSSGATRSGSFAQSSGDHQRSRSHRSDDTEFPAFSTTTAVYRKSSSKASKITLRLSCDGSTLEIEQCDYDIAKMKPIKSRSRSRPWSSAPNLKSLERDHHHSCYHKKADAYCNAIKTSASAWANVCQSASTPQGNQASSQNFPDSPMPFHQENNCVAKCQSNRGIRNDFSVECIRETAIVHSEQIPVDGNNELGSGYPVHPHGACCQDANHSSFHYGNSYSFDSPENQHNRNQNVFNSRPMALTSFSCDSKLQAACISRNCNDTYKNRFAFSEKDSEEQRHTANQREQEQQCILRQRTRNKNSDCHEHGRPLDVRPKTWYHYYKLDDLPPNTHISQEQYRSDNKPAIPRYDCFYHYDKSSAQQPSQSRNETNRKGQEQRDTIFPDTAVCKSDYKSSQDDWQYATSLEQESRLQFFMPKIHDSYDESRRSRFAYNSNSSPQYTVGNTGTADHKYLQDSVNQKSIRSYERSSLLDTKHIAGNNSVLHSQSFISPDEMHSVPPFIAQNHKCGCPNVTRPVYIRPSSFPGGYSENQYNSEQNDQNCVYSSSHLQYCPKREFVHLSNEYGDRKIEYISASARHAEEFPNHKTNLFGRFSSCTDSMELKEQRFDLDCCIEHQKPKTSKGNVCKAMIKEAESYAECHGECGCVHGVLNDQLIEEEKSHFDDKTGFMKVEKSIEPKISFNRAYATSNSTLKNEDGADSKTLSHEQIIRDLNYMLKNAKHGVNSTNRVQNYNNDDMNACFYDDGDDDDDDDDDYDDEDDDDDCIACDSISSVSEYDSLKDENDNGADSGNNTGSILDQFSTFNNINNCDIIHDNKDHESILSYSGQSETSPDSLYTMESETLPSPLLSSSQPLPSTSTKPEDAEEYWCVSQNTTKNGCQTFFQSHLQYPTSMDRMPYKQNVVYYDGGYCRAGNEDRTPDSPIDMSVNDIDYDNSDDDDEVEERGDDEEEIIEEKKEECDNNYVPNKENCEDLSVSDIETLYSHAVIHNISCDDNMNETRMESEYNYNKTHCDNDILSKQITTTATTINKNNLNSNIAKKGNNQTTPLNTKLCAKDSTTAAKTTKTTTNTSNPRINSSSDQSGLVDENGNEGHPSFDREHQSSRYPYDNDKVLTTAASDNGEKVIDRHQKPTGHADYSEEAKAPSNSEVKVFESSSAITNNPYPLDLPSRNEDDHCSQNPNDYGSKRKFKTETCQQHLPLLCFNYAYRDHDLFIGKCDSINEEGASANDLCLDDTGIEMRLMVNNGNRCKVPDIITSTRDLERVGENCHSVVNKNVNNAVNNHQKSLKNDRSTIMINRKHENDSTTDCQNSTSGAILSQTMKYSTSSLAGCDLNIDFGTSVLKTVVTVSPSSSLSSSCENYDNACNSFSLSNNLIDNCYFNRPSDGKKEDIFMPHAHDEKENASRRGEVAIGEGCKTGVWTAETEVGGFSDFTSIFHDLMRQGIDTVEDWSGDYWYSFISHDIRNSIVVSNLKMATPEKSDSDNSFLPFQSFLPDFYSCLSDEEEDVDEYYAMCNNNLYHKNANEEIQVNRDYNFATNLRETCPEWDKQVNDHPYYLQQQDKTISSRADTNSHYDLITSPDTGSKFDSRCNAGGPENYIGVPGYSHPFSSLSIPPRMSIAKIDNDPIQNCINSLDQSVIQQNIIEHNLETSIEHYSTSRRFCNKNVGCLDFDRSLHYSYPFYESRSFHQQRSSVVDFPNYIPKTASSLKFSPLSTSLCNQYQRSLSETLSESKIKKEFSTSRDDSLPLKDTSSSFPTAPYLNSAIESSSTKYCPRRLSLYKSSNFDRDELRLIDSTVIAGLNIPKLYFDNKQKLSLTRSNITFLSKTTTAMAHSSCSFSSPSYTNSTTNTIVSTTENQTPSNVLSTSDANNTVSSYQSDHDNDTKTKPSSKQPPPPTHESPSFSTPFTTPLPEPLSQSPRPQSSSSIYQRNENSVSLTPRHPSYNSSHATPFQNLTGNKWKSKAVDPKGDMNINRNPGELLPCSEVSSRSGDESNSTKALDLIYSPVDKILDSSTFSKNSELVIERQTSTSKKGGNNVCDTFGAPVNVTDTIDSHTKQYNYRNSPCCAERVRNDCYSLETEGGVKSELFVSKGGLNGGTVEGIGPISRLEDEVKSTYFSSPITETATVAVLDHTGNETNLDVGHQCTKDENHEYVNYNNGMGLVNEGHFDNGISLSNESTSEMINGTSTSGNVETVICKETKTNKFRKDNKETLHFLKITDDEISHYPEDCVVHEKERGDITFPGEVLNSNSGIDYSIRNANDVEDTFSCYHALMRYETGPTGTVELSAADNQSKCCFNDIENGTAGHNNISNEEENIPDNESSIDFLWDYKSKGRDVGKGTGHNIDNDDEMDEVDQNKNDDHCRNKDDNNESGRLTGNSEMNGVDAIDKTGSLDGTEQTDCQISDLRVAASDFNNVIGKPNHHCIVVGGMVGRMKDGRKQKQQQYQTPDECTHNGYMEKGKNKKKLNIQKPVRSSVFSLVKHFESVFQSE